MDTKESMEYLLRKLNFREEKPKFIDVNPVSQIVEGLKEGIVECGAMEKVSLQGQREFKLMRSRISTSTHSSFTTLNTEP